MRLMAAPRITLAYPGAVVADELMQFMGLAVILFIALPMAWAVKFVTHEKPERLFIKFLSWVVATLATCSALAMVPTPDSWRLAAGLGGNAGDVISSAILSLMAFALKGWFPQILTATLSAYLALIASLKATGLAGADASGRVEQFFHLVGAWDCPYDRARKGQLRILAQQPSQGCGKGSKIQITQQGTGKAREFLCPLRASGATCRQGPPYRTEP